MRVAWLGALALLGACQGDTGTLSLTLAVAPNSTLLDAATELRVTLTSPLKTYDITRGDDGFILAFDVTATGNDGQLIVDAYDANGVELAVGETPPLPISAVTSDVVVYMAPPLSLAASTQVMSTPCSHVATGALTYGVLFAGGLDGSGAPCSVLAIYNAYDHSLAAGSALPEARADLAIGVGTSGYVYLFGGTDSTGATAADLWQFDTTAAPSGSYTELADPSSDARAGASLLPLGDEAFLVTGAPVLELAGLAGTFTARTDVTTLPAAGVTVTPGDGTDVTIVAGDGAGPTGIERLRADAFTTIASDAAIRTGQAVVAGPNATAIELGGGTGGALSADGVIIDAAGSTATTIANALATPRANAAIAATDRYVVVAGGTDASGAVVATAEILDATTLAAVAVKPMVVPRTGANAVALPNGQVLILGGTDATGAPIATIELFTPDDPPATASS